MERLLVVRCPDLFLADEGGAVLRSFAAVVDAVGSYCPWVDAVRLGVCSLPTRGPARYFGGESALIDLARSAASSAAGGLVEVGIADGLFAAELAARTGALVPAGTTPEFLAPFPVDILEVEGLDQLLSRLGLHTLGGFAALPEADVLGRFGADGVAAHQVARGYSGDLDGRRDPRIARLLRGEQIEDDPPVVAPGFWGGTNEVDARAARCLTTVQGLLGPEAVTVARLQGGRSPAERARFVTWAPAHRPRPVVRTESTSSGFTSAPWPGRVPAPAPAVVHPTPLPIELTDHDGSPVRVSARGLLSAHPGRLSIADGVWRPVTGWAGPWPADERWWSPTSRRTARLQAITPDRALLLVAEGGRWWAEATYG